MPHDKRKYDMLQYNGSMFYGKVVNYLVETTIKIHHIPLFFKTLFFYLGMHQKSFYLIKPTGIIPWEPNGRTLRGHSFFSERRRGIISSKFTSLIYICFDQLERFLVYYWTNEQGLKQLRNICPFSPIL